MIEAVLQNPALNPYIAVAAMPVSLSHDTPMKEVRAIREAVEHGILEGGKVYLTNPHVMPVAGGFTIIRYRVDATDTNSIKGGVLHETRGFFGSKAFAQQVLSGLTLH